MSKSKLKKTLSALDKEKLIEVITELYDARKEAKEYLEYWLDPDSGKELERVQKLVSRQFVTPQGVARRTPSLPTVNKYIKDFMTICYERERVGELLLYVAEQMCDWLDRRYRRVSYRTSLRKYLDEAALYVENHELEDLYGIRLERLRERVAALEAYQNEVAPRRWGMRRRSW